MVNTVVLSRMVPLLTSVQVPPWSLDMYTPLFPPHAVPRYTRPTFAPVLMVNMLLTTVQPSPLLLTDQVAPLSVDL